MAITKEEVLKILGTQPGLPRLETSERIRIKKETIEVVAQLRIDWGTTLCTCIDTRHSNHCPVHYLIDEVIPLQAVSGTMIPLRLKNSLCIS